MNSHGDCVPADDCRVLANAYRLLAPARIGAGLAPPTPEVARLIEQVVSVPTSCRGQQRLFTPTLTRVMRHPNIPHQYAMGLVSRYSDLRQVTNVHQSLAENKYVCEQVLERMWSMYRDQLHGERGRTAALLSLLVVQHQNCGPVLSRDVIAGVLDVDHPDVTRIVAGYAHVGECPEWCTPDTHARLLLVAALV